MPNPEKFLFTTAKFLYIIDAYRIFRREVNRLGESKKAVREFMISIALGFAVYIPLICVGFLISGRFGLNVLLSALYGSAVMLFYYFLFARAIVKAADEQDPEAAKKRIQAAYSLRMFLLVLLMGIGVFFSTEYAPIAVFHWLPIIISMLIPRIAIAAWNIIQKIKGSPVGEEKDGEKSDDN